MKNSTKKRICIVTDGIFGVPDDAEISVYYSNLALFLASSGYDVSVLMVNNLIPEYREKINVIKNFCSNKNIKLFYILPADKNYFSYPLKTDNLINSYQVYNWFKTHGEFDVIFFSDYGGAGFYSLLAKHQGLRFEKTKMIVKVFHPLRWRLFANKTNFDSINYITDDFIERKSIESADILMSSSIYMIDWIKDNRWKMPDETIISPDIIYNDESLGETGINNDKIIEKRIIKELVYFGNFKTQFGLEIFMNSLDILKFRNSFSPNNITVTLLISGQEIDDSIINNLQDKAKEWNCRLNIIDSFDFNQSAKYLRGGGRLLVLPYLLGNAPYILTECFYHGIPFIASDKIASVEYINAAYIGKYTFSPEQSVLADKIQDCLSNGLISFAPFYNSKKAEANLINLIEKPIINKKGISEDFALTPKVSVCLVHHERPHFLKLAIDSLRKQDYQNFEVILVDDGSKDEESLKYLEGLSEEFIQRGWKIVKQNNLYPGAARNRAVREASGDYTLFLDDDDCLKPFGISTFVRAAHYSGADVLTCFNKIFNGELEPDDNDIRQISIFTGDIASGIFENSYGSVTAFFKKNIFFEIGGFHEIKGVAYEDWEIFAKLALKGYSVEVIPEPLFYYRILETNKNSVNRSTDAYYNGQRVLKAYADECGENMATAVMYLRDARILNYRLFYLSNYIIALKQTLKDKFGIIINGI